LHPNDFRSIWELSHIWDGSDPEKTDPANLPASVIDRIQKIVWGYLRKKLPVRKARGGRIPDSDIYIFLFNINRWRIRLIRCVDYEEYDKKFLSSMYVMRSEVLRWCSNEYITPPEIWAVDRKNDSNGNGGNKTISGRHKDDEINKQLCQAIARTLWDFDPRIHPAHMIDHKAIRKYGNGDIYRDDETVRNWIAEVDPLRKERKTGRPPDIRYKIDIENGGFSKEFPIQFSENEDSL